MRATEAETGDGTVLMVLVLVLGDDLCSETKAARFAQRSSQILGARAAAGVWAASSAAAAAPSPHPARN